MSMIAKAANKEVNTKVEIPMPTLAAVLKPVVLDKIVGDVTAVDVD